ncbi:hypothetical protein D1AOALGA4SA_2050 [Olavius algarvensis Delta 1 endosymbiont]|nr:hypothetical protein D1AOALGA4SA_2050 [Olavius algarvensis Delta 1 endosymbiont]
MSKYFQDDAARRGGCQTEAVGLREREDQIVALRLQWKLTAAA